MSNLFLDLLIIIIAYIIINRISPTNNEVEYEVAKHLTNKYKINIEKNTLVFMINKIQKHLNIKKTIHKKIIGSLFIALFTYILSVVGFYYTTINEVDNRAMYYLLIASYIMYIISFILIIIFIYNYKVRFRPLAWKQILSKVGYNEVDFLSRKNNKKWQIDLSKRILKSIE